MSSTLRKTDNGDLEAKLCLRRYFLERYHTQRPPHVFDACQAEGVLWARLRSTFGVASYWGVDRKPRRGRLAIDSARVLSLADWSFDVIDIDTYGSPWRHWLALLDTMRQPVTVFLTVGRSGAAGMQLSREEYAALGIEEWSQQSGGHFLGAFGRRLAELSAPILLARGQVQGRKIEEAKVVRSRSSHAVYYGLRIDTIS